MSRLAKHLGKGFEIELDGDKLDFKPLNTEHLPLLFKTMKGFSGASAGKPEDAFNNLDDDSMDAVKKLIDITMELSFPEAPEEERKQFGMKHWAILFEKIIEANSSIDEKEKNKLNAIERMQNESAKSA